MLRILTTRGVLALAGLCWFAWPHDLAGQTAATADETALLQAQAKKHVENDQLLDAERTYLAALKNYEKQLAAKNQNDALLLRWCQCRNELTDVQFRLFKMSEAKALAATTTAYLQQVIPLRASEPAFRFELAKTHQALANGYQYLQLFADAEKHQAAAIELLKLLAQEQPAKTDYRLTLAQGLKTYGTMLMGLGRATDSEAAFVEAEKIAAKLVADAPKVAEFALELALIYNSHALLIREAAHFLLAIETMGSAARLLAKLEAEYPTRPEYWFPLATVYRNMAQPLGYLGKAADADAVKKEAARVESKLAQTPPSARKWADDAFKLAGMIVAGDADRVAKQQREVEDRFKQCADMPLGNHAIPFIYGRMAALLGSRGQQLAARGLRDDARKQFQQAIDLMEKVNEHHHGMPILRSILAELHIGLGVTFLSENQCPEGDRCLRCGFALLEKSAQEHPQVPSFRYLLSDHLMRIVMAMSARSQVKEAIRYLAEAQDQQKKLAEAYPACPQYRRLQAQTQGTRARLLQADHANLETEAALREGIRLWAKASADFPATIDYRKSWAKDYGLLGQLLLRCDKAKEAHDAFSEALKLNQQLYAEHPREPEYHMALAIAHLWMAQVHEKQERHVEAIDADTKAIALWESALQLNPRQRNWLSELRSSLVHRANLELKLRKQAEYLSDLERAKELAEMLEAPLFRLGRIEERGQKGETLQVALKEADDLFQNVDLTDAEWHRLALFYLDLSERTANFGEKNAMAARAVVALGQAVQLGFSRASLRQDERLQPLANREDFRRLVQGN